MRNKNKNHFTQFHRLAKRCPYTGKVSYKNKKKAVAEAHRIHQTINKNGGESPRPGNPYRCPHCGKWHLTSLEQE